MYKKGGEVGYRGKEEDTCELCVCACVRACVRACVCVCMDSQFRMHLGKGSETGERIHWSELA